jgi:hypothetical protein
VKRRHFLTVFVLAAPLLALDAGATSVRGKLMKGSDGKPCVRTSDGKSVALLSDEPTMLVLNDERLAGKDFEALGHVKGPDTFEINPIHTPSLFIHEAGARLRITYWCDVCYIRTYSPGTCWCCQQETKLDLIDPDKVGKT